VVFVVWTLIDVRNDRRRPAEQRSAEPRPEQFDAFTGGYPVPPMPGETLPQTGPVHATTAPGEPAMSSTGRSSAGPATDEEATRG
jgi:NADH-quinone oxidoreductase subunit H